jgi:Barrel-sandwich domain of CusB or HlyD membrane-fusion
MNSLPSSPATSPAADGALPLARAALAVQAALLSCASLADAAQACVRELALRFGFDRVALALAGPHGRLDLLAVSDGLPAGDGPALLAALGESFDQRASVQWPQPDAGGAPRITLAHRTLIGQRSGSAAGLPLAHAGQVIGALCLQRRRGGPVPPDELLALEHLACLIGPLLDLMRSNQRPLARRALDDLQHWFSAAGKPEPRRLRLALAAGAAMASVLLLLPAQLHIGGRARLEGAVQRVLAAPADGFVQQVHARPGDTVQAGQALVDLADQDLQLERQRWQSQLAQHLDAYAAANARADRTQLVMHQSRADEAQAQLELVDAKLQRSRLAAPFDGIVVQGDLSQQLGAPVKQGAELMTLAPRDRFRVIVEVDERDIAHVQVGQPGTLALSALPWSTLPMRLTRITPMANAVEGRNVFEVEAELLQHPSDLRPGLQGSAQISAGRASTLWRWTRRIVEAARLGWWEWFG